MVRKSKKIIRDTETPMKAKLHNKKVLTERAQNVKNQTKKLRNMRKHLQNLQKD